MSLSDFLILYTPLSYGVFLVVLYFLSYLRDPFRFIHPHRESGEEMWPDVLLHLKLITNEDTSRPFRTDDERFQKGTYWGCHLQLYRR